MLEYRWVIWGALGSIFGLLAFLSGNTRKWFFVLFVLGLQISIFLYLGDVSHRARYVGQSGPTGFVIPFVTIPAAFLLIRHWLPPLFDHDRQKTLWGAEITYPAAWVFLTSAVGVFYSTEPWRVIYYLFQLLLFYIVFLAILNTARSRDQIVLVYRLLMLTLGIQCCVYFIQYATGITFSLIGETSYKGGGVISRHGGTVGTTPAQFASFILPLTFIAFSRFLKATDRGVFLPMGILATMGTVTLILTYTRAAWVGFCLGMVWLIVIGLKQRSVRANRLILILVMGIVVLVALQASIEVRLNADGASAFDERSYLMAIAWNVILNHPILGVGAGSYSYIFRGFIPPGLDYQWLHVVHNVYLLRWAETGIFGLISFIMLLLAGLRQSLICIRSKDETLSALALGWSAGLIALCWEMFWDNGIGIAANSLMWLMFGLILAVKKLESNEVRETSKGEGLLRPQWSTIR